MSIVAITREVSPGVERCELTHLERGRIDYELAVEQHRLYVDCLVELGCDVVQLSGDTELPDCVFVEDIAVVLDEVAILTRPGAASRRAETPAVRAALEPFRSLEEIREPGVVDGGDVLVVDRRLFVGLSTRTNESGLEQLSGLLEPYGYEVLPVEFDSCLHLKSAVTRVAERTLLIQQEWVDPGRFAGFELIPVDPTEPHGGNALRLRDTVIYADGFERTRGRMEAHGLKVCTVDQSELKKAEGGVTCCSLIFEGRERD